MPYSKKQQRTAGLALAIKRGYKPKKKIGKALKSMMKSMTLDELRDFARGPVKRKHA